MQIPHKKIRQDNRKDRVYRKGDREEGRAAAGWIDAICERTNSPVSARKVSYERQDENTMSWSIEFFQIK
jgi:hypothetical protein